jgi:hypothetical protein
MKCVYLYGTNWFNDQLQRSASIDLRHESRFRGRDLNPECEARELHARHNVQFLNCHMSTVF